VLNYRIRLVILAIVTYAVIAPGAHAQILAGNRKLVIDGAVWGRNGQGSDVTNRVRRLIRNNSLDFKVNNSNLGGDPNKGTVKTLKISYTYNGRRQNRVYNEGDRCRIP
jgi:hypothetical protein